MILRYRCFQGDLWFGMVIAVVYSTKENWRREDFDQLSLSEPMDRPEAVSAPKDTRSTAANGEI